MNIIEKFSEKINGALQTFANEQTALLCSHIENYIKESHVKVQYLESGKLNKDEPPPVLHPLPSNSPFTHSEPPDQVLQYI